MRQRVALLAAVALVGIASACGGPRTPVAIGVKEFPTDVLFGSGDGNLTRLEKPPIETNPVVAPPRRPRRTGTAAAPTPTVAPTPAPPCPEVDPLSAPKVEAGNRVHLPPVEGTYAFRTTGYVEIDGKKTKLPVEAKRTIRNVDVPNDDRFTFEVLDEIGTSKTLYRYGVIKSGNLDEGVKGETGMFLLETVRGDGADAKVTYTWDPPIPLLRFPIEHGDTWQANSTALDGQVVMSFSARLGVPVEDNEDDADPLPQTDESKVRVDACGEYIDAWNVQVGEPDTTGERSGRYVSPECFLGFDEGYAIAPQYGAMIVNERRFATGDCDGAAITSERTSTINSLPKPPKA